MELVTKMMVVATIVPTVDVGVSIVNADAFTEPSSWDTFDAKGNSPPEAKGGYGGVVSDGSRYVYFIPHKNDTDWDGQVLRYDTLGDFGTSSSWSTYDYGDNCGQDCNDPDGYNGAVFDGQYIYFVPDQNGDGYHGEVLRYDTQCGFADAGSWTAYDPGANGVGGDLDGYLGAVYDGQYVYFSPHRNNVIGNHGKVLRYDTHGGFSVASSWLSFDVVANAVADGGYAGVVFDRIRHVYFVPYKSEIPAAPQSEVLRYDTLGDFTNVSSWTTYDYCSEAAENCNSPDGYSGAIFDGYCVYFAPLHSAGGESTVRCYVMTREEISTSQHPGQPLMPLPVLQRGAGIAGRSWLACYSFLPSFDCGLHTDATCDSTWRLQPSFLHRSSSR